MIFSFFRKNFKNLKKWLFNDFQFFSKKTYKKKEEEFLNFCKQYYRLINIKYYKMKSIVISYVIKNEIKYINGFNNVKLSY